MLCTRRLRKQAVAQARSYSSRRLLIRTIISIRQYISMNNKEFIIELSQRTGLTQSDVQRLVTAFVDEMVENFDAGNAVLVPSFGTFEVKKRLERVLVNPSTGKRMLVPPKLVLGFKPVAAVKEKLKGGK
ncbi:MAG: HU family DNA-binding protein [Prevotellaceae bacterium]|nr:HU family DNA-binding protein [Prevotellaceae bacterium]